MQLSAFEPYRLLFAEIYPTRLREPRVGDRLPARARSLTDRVAVDLGEQQTVRARMRSAASSSPRAELMLGSAMLVPGPAALHRSARDA